MSFPNTVLRLGGGRGDSVQFRPVCWRGFFQALLAQLAEQLTLNQRVASSSLAQGIHFIIGYFPPTVLVKQLILDLALKKLPRRQLFKF